jgi:HEAT repeat protein
MRSHPLRSTIYLLASMAFAMLVAVAPVARAAEITVEQQVVDLLSAYEEAPSSQELSALGPTVPDVLRSYAQDSRKPLSMRARAIHALGWYPDATDHALLLSWATGSDTPDIFRRKAVFALVNGWGEVAVPEVAPLFSSTDVQLRLAIVRAFSALPAEKVRASLQTQLEVETNQAVRDALSKALQ